MEKKLKTINDILSMKITPMEPFKNMYDCTLETLFDWYISKMDGERRIQLFLQEWDEEAQQYWKNKLDERIEAEEKRFDGFDEYEINMGLENKDDVWWGDVFWLRYHDINVFFAVSFTDTHKVAIYELAKRKFKSGDEVYEEIINQYQPTRSPYVVLKNNCSLKTNHWVETETKYLEMPDGKLMDVKTLKIIIKPYDRLYKKAQEKGIDFPDTGTFSAIYVPDVENVIFPCAKPKHKKVKKLKKDLN